MGGLVEGFTTFVLKDNQKEEKEELYTNISILVIVLLIKAFFIYIVSKFLWPKVMPKVSSNIKSKPSFMTLFGLSIIYSLLF